MTQLNPCPDCGGRAVTLSDMVQTWIQCEDCGRRSKARLDPENAAREWNGELKEEPRIRDRVSPCAGCGKRTIGCHSHCEEFVEWQNEKKEVNRLKQLNDTEHRPVSRRDPKKIRWRRWH